MARVSLNLPEPGDVLAGKFRVERLLGVGGMGVVVCAHHLQLDERVALKFLRPEALTNPEAVARFDREARAAVKIKSEHVARVTDVGRLESGAPYMVMEYLEGRDMSAWLAERGALPVEQAVEFVLQACEAIADAHALGIIHRDLKPSNLFCIVRSDGMPAVKVLDFGISKLTGLSASGPDMGMTRTQSLMGSPLYMSPEQMQASKGVDARTDIWALGVILFELVTGRTPFNGEGIPDLVLNIVNGPTPSVRSVRPAMPIALEQVVQRCLEKDRANRYANVAELATALADLAPKRALASVEKIARIIQNAGLARPALAVSQPVLHVGPTPAGTISGWGQTAPGGRGKATAVVGLIAGMALLSIVAVVVVVKSRAHAAAGGGTTIVAAPPGSASATATAVAAQAAAAAPAPSPPVATAEAAPVTTLPEVEPAPTASAPAAAPSVSLAQPSAQPVPSTLPHASPAVHVGAARSAKPVCSAVPYVDGDGNTHFKQVCR